MANDQILCFVSEEKRESEIITFCAAVSYGAIGFLITRLLQLDSSSCKDGGDNELRSALNGWPFQMPTT